MLEVIGLIIMILRAADYCIHNNPRLGIVIFVFLILYFGLDAWAVRYKEKKRRKHRREEK
ncbi:MAG: hypothetical protein VB119_07160 [Candidatus Metalachnospira sp.]|nr:hypothetical protein [Candidatus Metalachnospira sp.]